MARRPTAITFHAALVLVLGAMGAWADEWRTTTSLMGESKYGSSFARYDYVNPDAPKGGTVNLVATGTFDSFNPFIIRGTAAAGLGGFGGGLLYDTLMSQSTDEPSTSHPLIADGYKFPDDFSSATYRINPEAKWHDGTPITAEDVVWSLGVLKANSPDYNAYYANIIEAVALSEREVEFRFDQKGNRELPHIIGDLVVLPKHWWEGTDASGRKRDISQPTLEPPLGSGAYRIESFKPGVEIVWARVADYWASELAVNVGRNNFDRMRFTYFQDDNAAWQAFTKGGFQDYRVENRSRRWATEYNFPAFEAGDVIKEEFPRSSGEQTQAFYMNLRRPQFQDRRVRMALNYIFDFETMNRTLFFDSYTRTSSYFPGTELAATGLPQGEELKILKEFEKDLPPELLTEEFKLPAYDRPEARRENQRRAFELLTEAGWENRGGRLVNAETGEQMKIEFLGDDPTTDELIAGQFITGLRKFGIDASLRIVDASQYVNRVRNFDFDIVSSVFRQSLSPGNEQRDYWGSASADKSGSRNIMGIKDPVIDKLVDRVIFAEDRKELVAATRALDRVLLWNHFFVPQWHNPKIWLAYWNKFGRPEKQPAYSGVDIDSWWVEPDFEATLAKKYGRTN